MGVPAACENERELEKQRMATPAGCWPRSRRKLIEQSFCLPLIEVSSILGEPAADQSEEVRGPCPDRAKCGNAAGAGGEYRASAPTGPECAQLLLSVKGVDDSLSFEQHVPHVRATGGRTDRNRARARDGHRPIVPLGTIGCRPYLAADFVAYSKARCQRYLLHILGANRSVARIWPLNPIVPNCCRDYRRS